MTVETEHLTDGWEADAPVGDTLLRRFVFNLAAAHEVVVGPPRGRALLRDDVAVADLGRPAGIFNAVTLLQPPRPERFEETLDAAERFVADGIGPVMLWSAWPTPDLRPRGWELEGHPTLLLRPPSRLPDTPPTVPGARIEEVHDVDGLRDWERVAAEAFPLPGPAILDEHALAGGTLRLWVGYEGGRPLAIGSLVVACGVAHPLLAVTLPEAQRRGFAIAIGGRALATAPDLPAMALGSDSGRPTAEAGGFVPICRFTAWHRTR